MNSSDNQDIKFHIRSSPDFHISTTNFIPRGVSEQYSMLQAAKAWISRSMLKRKLHCPYLKV